MHLRKRRYRCACGKRFFEKNTFLPRYYRITSRLVSEIIHAFEKVVPAKEIGCRFKNWRMKKETSWRSCLKLRPDLQVLTA